MTQLDLSPSPGPSSTGRRIWSHALVEATMVVRNGEQLLLALVIPVALLVGGYLFGERLGFRLDLLLPSVLALAVWSSTFTSLAIMTGFERRDGVLERLVSTPLGPTGLVVGKALAVTVIAAGQIIILGALGALLGWRPTVSPLGVVVAVAAIILAGLTFAGFALTLAGQLKAEVTLALANLIYLVGLLAGIMVPAQAFRPSLALVVSTLPTGALAGTLRSAAIGDTVWIPLLILGGWALLSILLARRTFRWMS